MERARHRRSKSASGIEGTRQVQKQKAISRLSTDARPYFDRSTWDDMVMVELGRRSYGQVTGMPMKKLLAEEMSKDVESKKQSPSVIARLMGLEVMPPHCHVHRQPKRTPDGQWKNVAVNLQQNSQLHDGQLSRRSMIDQQEFKDVYEDMEASHVVNRQCSPRWHASSSCLNPEVTLIQRKFIDAKHLSANEKLHIAVLKPLNSVKYGGKEKAWRPQRDTFKRNHVTSHVKREDDLLLESQNFHRAHISCHFSRPQLEEKNEENKFPKKVVLLKPNLARISLSGSSPNQLSSKNKMEFPGVQGAGFTMPISTKARDIAREITMNMRNVCNVKGNVNTWSSGFKGYAGDESSYDASESDSESELEEEFKLSSGKSFGGLNLGRYPSSHLGESSVNMEGKKRLTERWKTTHKYQDLEMIRKGSTLGEMLALPERETRAHHSNTKTSLDRPNDCLGSNSGSVTWDPLGINTRDGWKDEIIKNLSRPRSLPPSRAGRCHMRSTHCYELTEDKPMIHCCAVHHDRNKAIKGNLSHEEHNSPKVSKSRSTKRHSGQHMFLNETKLSSEARFEIQMEASSKDFTEQLPIIQMTEEEDMFNNSGSDATTSAESESPTLPLKSPELNSNLLSSIVDGEKCPTDGLEDSTLQFGTEPDPSNSFKEADHCSPVSVLEVPFTEDTPSSFESFERVGAELHELQMQLQLLKMESGECADIVSTLPIEEQIAQPLPAASEGNQALGAEVWETSYTLDVLISSGLQHSDANIFRTKWYSPDSPLDPNLFNILEIKHNNDTCEMRSKRRLLFDRINSALVQIFEEYVDLHPWLMPNLRLNQKKKEVVGYVLEKLMKVDFAEGEKSSDGMVMQWTADSKAEIEVICNEIEKLLIDDIITELVSY